MEDEPRVAIVGVGPVGGIMGAYLSHAGHYVVMCDVIKTHLDAIQESGLTITGVSEISTKCKGLAYHISELSNFPEVNTVVISTKASVMPRIVPDIAKVVQPGTQFICNQNGLGNEEFLAETFGPDNILRIVPNYAGGIVEDGKIWMSFFNPPNYIGAMTPKGEAAARQMADMMTEAGLDTQFTTNIIRYEWEKVILNAALNPVCALTRKTMKDMMGFETTESLVEELMREGIEVAEAAGVTFDEGFFEHGVQYLKKAGHHKPSMLQDIEREVPTEIDWINCMIVEWGQANGVETPYNSTIASLIKGLEMESEAPEKHS
ncbi:MAG: ketopantoate reductase family protein [Anaerolineaceae bacterium]|nr:MAG: ketopantoate reductase family protein [Anaerolineaceae bacterium]